MDFRSTHWIGGGKEKRKIVEKKKGVGRRKNEEGKVMEKREKRIADD